MKVQRVMMALAVLRKEGIIPTGLRITASALVEIEGEMLPVEQRTISPRVLQSIPMEDRTIAGVPIVEVVPG